MEYDDEYEMYDGGFQSPGLNEVDNEDEQNDAPTVVIDSSLDDKDYASEFRRIDSTDDIKGSGVTDTNDNI